MRVAKLTAIQKIEISEEVFCERPGRGQAVVQVKAAGICGTDLHIFKEGRADVTLPRIMGHELSGIVTEIGDGVTKFRPGDKVVLDPVISCGRCRACRSGHENVCEDVKCFGVQVDGGFRDYIIADERRLYPFPCGLSFEEAALAEPFSVASNILWKAGLKEGERLAVIGAGTIGLAILQAAKGIGASVLISDIDEEKLKLAKQFGADRTVHSGKENLKKAADEFYPGGADVVIDAVGTSSLTQSVLELAAPCARAAVIAFDMAPMQIPPAIITKKELTLTGSRMNCGRFPEVLSWMEAGKIHPEKMITAVYPFEEIQAAFEEMQKGGRTDIKTILRF